MAGPNSRKCCQLFEIESNRLPEHSLCLYALFIVYICIWLQKLLMHQGQAFSQGNGSVCRIFEFLTIAGMMPVGLAADSEACKLLHNDVTKTEQGTF